MIMRLRIGRSLTLGASDWTNLEWSLRDRIGRFSLSTHTGSGGTMPHRPLPFSTCCMKSPAQRLTDLEIKASFTEDLVDQLNEVVVRQQRQIDALLREVADLRQQPPEDPGARPFRSLRDELPPHY